MNSNQSFMLFELTKAALAGIAACSTFTGNTGLISVKWAKEALAEYNKEMECIPIYSEGELSKLIAVAKDEAYKQGREDEKNAVPDFVPLNASIETLGLQTRTHSALWNNNIRTVGGLIGWTEQRLRRLEGLGNVSINNIKQALKPLNLKLKD